MSSDHFDIAGIEKQYTKKILALFKNMPAGTSLILFGSRAKGNYREGSGIDLAIKGSGVTLDQRTQWLAEYENLFLPWKLDLVIYELTESQNLKEHIDRVGKQLLRW